jgi:predicted transposase/invertase (TIGR01784 family)
MQYIESMGLRFTNDFVFRYVLGREEAKSLLMDLVNAVLEDAGCTPIISLDLRNPVNPRDASWAKETVLDIKAVGQDRQLFDIEMQVSGDRHFVNRSLYYWAQLYSRQLEKGHEYDELRPVICINLLDFDLFEGTAENHHRFIITEAGTPELVMTEDLQIHFVELTKPAVRETHLKLWTQLIGNAGKDGEDMKVLLSKDRVLSQTYAEFERCTQDEEVRELALARERFQLDQRSSLKTARQDGFEEGKKKGLEEGKKEGKKEGLEEGKKESMREVARLLQAKGLAPELIQSITGHLTE